MIKWLLRRQLAAFERTWNYDAAYLHEMLDADARALMLFGKVQALSRYRKDVPPSAYCAAGIVAVMKEDCEPCTQLAIDMAESGGVAPSVLRAIVARDYAAMPAEAALAARFAEASLRHVPEANELREEVLRQWGRRALIALVFAIVTASMYPTLKYGLGHGRACTRLTVGGETLSVRELDKGATQTATA